MSTGDSAVTPSLDRMVRAALAAGLLAALGACSQTGGTATPGYVNTSAASGYNNGAYSNRAYNGGAYVGSQGRVMAIREVALRGSTGMNDGTLVGGGLGAAGGAAVGAATTNSVGGAVVGGLLGAVGGAIAGTAIGSNSGSSRRGIEVTVQQDDGRTVTIAQPDDGDVQMGDRVRIVQDRNGAAVAIRDQGYRRES